MIKILEQIDTSSILDVFNNIEKDIVWTSYGHKGKQSGLQFKDNEDPWTSAVGRSQGQELEYDNLNPFFKDTIFETLINKYNFKRTRLMWVGPYACYSIHKDETPRIHIPLITNPECYFVFVPGILRNIPIESVYWVDTRLRHTFINCSKYPRLHLVGVVES